MPAIYFRQLLSSRTNLAKKIAVKIVDDFLLEIFLKKYYRQNYLKIISIRKFSHKKMCRPNYA